MLAFSNDYYGMIFRATQSVELFCAYLIYACKEGEEKIHTASQVNLTEPFKEMRNEKINILG